MNSDFLQTLSFQMIFLIAVLFVFVEALHIFHDDAKFYYLQKIIGVGLELKSLLTFHSFSLSLLMIHCEFTAIYISIVCTRQFNKFKFIYFFLAWIKCNPCDWRSYKFQFNSHHPSGVSKF